MLYSNQKLLFQLQIIYDNCAQVSEAFFLLIGKTVESHFLNLIKALNNPICHFFPILCQVDITRFAVAALKAAFDHILLFHAVEKNRQGTRLNQAGFRYFLLAFALVGLQVSKYLRLTG